MAGQWHRGQIAHHYLGDEVWLARYGFRDDDGVTHRVQRIGPADEHDKHGRLADEALIANLEKLLVLAGQ